MVSLVDQFLPAPTFDLRPQTIIHAWHKKNNMGAIIANLTYHRYHPSWNYYVRVAADEHFPSHC